MSLNFILLGTVNQGNMTTTNVIPLPVSFRKKRISVIMVTYHTGAPLTEAIQAVLSDSDIFELILIDNGNTPAVRERIWKLVKDKHRLHIVQGQGNIGFARACNYGVRLAQGDYLFFLNPDAIIVQGAAQDMAQCGETLMRPWVTGGLLQTVEGDEQRGARRAELTPISAVISFTPLHKLPGLKSIHLEREPCPEHPVAIDVVSGACLMTDRESFEILGGFDENYFLHVEDFDICRRSRKAGGEVYFVPSAKVLHYGSTSNVRIQDAERKKLRGFFRYFEKYSGKWWIKTLNRCAYPLMYIAIMGRAWWLAFRTIWKTRS